ncbi:hypothetical protein ACKKBG_A40325 [Auxenochlorella protothecoides x Auxenochlorella symbiontica]
MSGRLFGCFCRATSGAVTVPFPRPRARLTRSIQHHSTASRSGLFDPSITSFSGPWTLTSARGARTGAVAGTSASMAGSEDPLIQYIIIREDLWKEQGWSLGSVMAQGCHAAVAAVWESKGAKSTEEYCSSANIDSMRKVVLQVPNEAQLLRTATCLESAGIAHKVWMEQPEAIPTCIATTPQLKSIVGSALKRLPLCKRPLYMSRGRGDGGEL